MLVLVLGVVVRVVVVVIVIANTREIECLQVVGVISRSRSGSGM